MKIQIAIRLAQGAADLEVRNQRPALAKTPTLTDLEAQNLYSLRVVRKLSPEALARSLCEWRKVAYADMPKHARLAITLFAHTADATIPFLDPIPPKPKPPRLKETRTRGFHQGYATDEDEGQPRPGTRWR